MRFPSEGKANLDRYRLASSRIFSLIYEVCMCVRVCLRVCVRACSSSGRFASRVLILIQ